MTENKYKVFAMVQLKSNISTLKKDISLIDNKERLEAQIQLINEQMKFAFQIQLINFRKLQQLQMEIQELLEEKLQHNRTQDFKEQIINKNDDTYTPRERLYDMRENEKKSLNEWKDEIKDMKKINSDPSSNSSEEIQIRAKIDKYEMERNND